MAEKDKKLHTFLSTVENLKPLARSIIVLFASDICEEFLQKTVGVYIFAQWYTVDILAYDHAYILDDKGRRESW